MSSIEEINICYGSKEFFEKEIVGVQGKNFGAIIGLYDSIHKSQNLIITKKDEKCEAEDYERPIIKEESVIMYSDEYVSVAEHVIQNFLCFLEGFEIKKLYINNPPKILVEQLKRKFNNKILKEKYEEFEKIKLEKIIEFSNQYNYRIKGQNSARQAINRMLYQFLKTPNKKPIVLMFYGKSGVGKTETAKFLSEILGEDLFRKQLSMFQNNDFITYLFGGKYNENSLAKDLLNRTSNVILLDEFDKAAEIANSAFYQLFDEGKFVDKNYEVNLENSIIICTSNYLTQKEARRKLGEPLYYRFDAFIHFEDLSETAVREIINLKIADFIKNFDEKELKIFEDEKIREKLLKLSSSLSNAREIEKVVRSHISDVIVKKIIDETTMNSEAIEL